MRTDEIIDPVTPHIVLNEFSSLRVGDHYLQGQRWVRVLDTAVVPAPPGRRIPDALTVTWTDLVRSSVTGHGAIEARGNIVRRTTDPGDRATRIVREIHPGNRVRSVSNYTAGTAVVISVTEYDANGHADVVLDADYSTLTVSRGDLYAVTEGTRP